MMPIFAAPWVLLALAFVPLLWWLLRVTPPLPRRQIFPAIRLLRDLDAAAETPAQTPLWLLALRMLAAVLVILALARPVLDAGRDLAGSGDLVLVIDDGWAAAQDWSARMQAAEAALARAERAGVKVALLTTAPGFDGAAPAVRAAQSPADLRPVLAALRPKPWPTQRAAQALAGIRAASLVFITDGVGEMARFADRLADLAPVELVRSPAPPVLLLPPISQPDGLTARVASSAVPAPRTLAVLAQAGDGRSLARMPLVIPTGADHAEVTLRLPPELRNSLTRLVIEGVNTAAAQVLLDERWRRRPVGLLAATQSAQAPLTGALFYLKRALSPFAELREGDLSTLLARDLSVLILADRPVVENAELALLEQFLAKGGTLIRFAGPDLAEHPDALLPVKLLGGERQFGGTMSWTQPPGLAAFEPSSPFAGLGVPAEVHITRQVLAAPGISRAVGTDPGSDPVWARLADGTPLVTQAARGAGRIVLFHVTANADWSDLPLSGLFIDMLRRLVAQSAGVAAAEARGLMLAPAEILDGFGTAGPPAPPASAIEAEAIGSETVSPRHPPGLYGPEAGRRALNVGTAAAIVPSGPVPGASVTLLGEQGRERPLAPALMAAAVVLLLLDLLLSLRLRGLWWPALSLVLVLVFSASATAQDSGPNPALVTRLGYIATGDDALDAISRAGLQGLATYVNRRTNAALGPPAALVPGQDDMSFYPLVYWPITASTQPQPAAWIAAVNDYTAHGGIVLIDTNADGVSEDSAQALRRAGTGLAVPALTPLAPAHVLARSFYLLQDFPGRITGETVWVQRDQDRANDSVSPFIIGAHGWAQAWAIDAQGRNPYATLPGGARQRVLAYRFGVNLVMYALTGNYKGDQVHVPALLERLGQ
jgi:hypothetical protein